MQTTSRSYSLPNLDRLSILAATILLAYGLARFINFTIESLAIQLPGFLFSLEIDLQTIVSVLVAGLAVAGADWLIMDHPALGKRTRFEHLLLPALTAWVIGIPLFQLPLGWSWWVGLLGGGSILILVLIAEYFVVDAEDVRQPIASAGLIVVSFTLFLILAAALRFASLRLYLVLPAIAIVTLLVSLRTLQLRYGSWLLWQAGLVTLVVGQLAAALHYWPLAPVAYGLVLLGAAYSLTSLVGNLWEGRSLKQAMVEPLIVLAIFWGITVWIQLSG